MYRFFLVFVLVSVFSLKACLQSNTRPPVKKSAEPSGWFVDERGDTIYKLNKTDAQWKAELDEMSYYVMRGKGTERAFTGEYNANKKNGVYVCNACDLPLFSSSAKFESGTGWPSFYKPIDKTHVLEESDNTLGMTRVEVLCHRCGGHLGHVFEDGPKPTGLRYCMNSAALDFKEQ